jgi:glycosyltransferase involved in cell wall biosynthesis
MSLNQKNQQPALSASNPHFRIVLASGIYPPDIGGPATYSRLIAGEFVKRDIGVSMVCYSDKRYEETDKNDNFKIIRVVRKKFFLFRYLVYFWNLFKLAKNCDIIYAQGPLGAGFPALVVAKALRKKFIVKIVGDYAWEQYQNKFSISNFQFSKLDDIETFQNKKYDFLTELRRKIQEMVVKSADKVITPSEFLKKIIGGWGVKKEGISVIYNAGPEIKQITDTVSKTGLEGDILASAGRLEPWKGMVALVEIMPDLLQKNPHFRLLIAGDGPLIEDLKSKIQNLNLQNRVILAGRVPRDELMSYFKASKIFILNTGYEGLPHITLEAMACGLPVVTTNICGNPEVIKDNYNGLLVEYNNKEQLKNAILKIWDNLNLKEEFVRNGKKVLENFTREKMINETIKALFDNG